MEDFRGALHKVRLENKAQVSESHRGLTAIRADTELQLLVDIRTTESLQTGMCSFRGYDATTNAFSDY
ncbi:hypothetical protein OkiPb01528_48700 [Escherichia coli]